MARPVPQALDNVAAWAWRVTVIAVPLYFLGRFLVRLWPVAAAVGVALLLTALLKPPVDWLAGRGAPRFVATLLVFTVALLALAALGAWIVPQIASQLSDLRPALRDALTSARTWLINGPLGLDRAQVDQLREDLVNVVPVVGKGSGGGQGLGLLAGGMLVAEFLALFLATLVLSFFLVKDGDEITRWTLDQLNEKWREPARAMGAAAWDAFSGYIRGVAILATFNAVASAIAYAVIGVPLFLALAVIEFFLSWIPLIGSITAGAIAALIALASGGIVDALLVVGVAIAIEQIEGNFFEPIVIGRSVKLHAAVVIVVLTAGALLAGVLGALIAVPLVAVIAAATGAVRARRRSSAPGAPNR